MAKVLRLLQKHRERVAIKDSCCFIHKTLKCQQGLSIVGTRAYIKRYSYALNVYKNDYKMLSLLVRTLYELWKYWNSKNFEDTFMIDYWNLYQKYAKTFSNAEE